ncbi:unnamed protein product [Linum trigynum]|uniref:Uncharacterized protein n=1 Tax=Linum trigynum TaxID=586398 RepID=A0AAV2EWC8_9ROSI
MNTLSIPSSKNFVLQSLSDVSIRINEEEYFPIEVDDNERVTMLFTFVILPIAFQDIRRTNWHFKAF